MGLFSKKNCDICGEKIGLFGNRKLEDGNICSHCADKLSPWFDDRRHSTLEEIKAQLESREENKKAVAAFHTSMELGECYKVLIDEDAGKFLVATAAGVMMMGTSNPDVFSFDQLKDARIDISESRSELYREDSEGNRKSYNPRRYVYKYNFYVELTLDHPYVDDIRMKVNEDTVEIEWQDQGFSLFSTNSSPTRDYEYRRYKSMCQEIVDSLTRGRRSASRQEPEEEVPAPVPEEEDGDMMFCPYCGSRVKKAKFCTNCGAKME